MFPELKQYVRKVDWKLPYQKIGDNKALDDTIAAIKKANPHLFWQEHELHQRRFYDQPIWRYPMKSFVRAYKK
jgi:hypothetical protein